MILILPTIIVYLLFGGLGVAVLFLFGLAVLLSGLND